MSNCENGYKIEMQIGNGLQKSVRGSVDRSIT